MPDLFASAATSADPSINDQILAAELWVLGLRDWVERHETSRKRTEEEIARKRHQLALAGAVVETLRTIKTAPGGTP